LEPSISAREWGKRQAAASPPWTEAKWQRIATLLGMQLASPPADTEQRDAEKPAEAA
jgi:hypothetical protein